MSEQELNNKDYELQIRRNPQSLLEEYPRKGTKQAFQELKIMQL